MLAASNAKSLVSDAGLLVPADAVALIDIPDLRVHPSTATAWPIPCGRGGKYVGLGHPVAVDHLIQPRTTAVERMPVHRFVHDAN